MTTDGSTVGETYCWNDRVACRTLDGTAFVLLDSRMVSLNEVGTVVWEAFENGCTLNKAIDVIVARFDVIATVAESDVRLFVGDLVQRQLLVPMR